MNRRTLAALGITLLSAPLQAQQSPTADSAIARNTTHDAAPVIRAARRSGAAIHIDGKIDEAAWNAAIPATSFRQSDPNEGQPGSERTEARVLVDDDALYVAMRLFDSDPSGIRAELARRDEAIEGDIAEVYLDSYHDHLTGYVFRLTPLGAKRDAAMSSSGNQDQSWDPVWDGAASMDAQGWSAEFRIPLSQLRYDPGAADHTWGIQLTRRIARKGETQFFAFVPKTQQAGINTWGHVTGLGRLPAPRRVELVPYVSTKNDHPTAEPGDPFRKKNQLAPGAGLDVKYGITSNLTLNATFNPDFGQVEVDPAVVNLSAFETFFPERRPFFVEGASIFGFGSMRTFNSSNGYNFTHTRRIGRTPVRGDIYNAGYDFIDAPLETTIAGAAKLTGRTKGGWSIGVLDAVTTKEEARFRTALGRDSSAVVEPLANYFVGRLKRDLNDGNTTLGVALNTVHRDLSDDSLDPFFRTSAYVGGFDWNHAWHKKEWSFDGSFVMTRNVGSAAAITRLQRSAARYYQRPDREELLLDPTRTSLTGHMFEASLAKLSGAHWRFSLTAQDYNPGFEPNEIGFMGSTDMRGIAPLFGYVETKVGKVLRFRESYVFWNPSWNYDGDMTFNGVGALSFFQDKGYRGYFVRLDWRPQVFDDRLTRGGPVGINPTRNGFGFEFSSDSRKKHTYGFFSNYFRDASAGGWFGYFGPRLTLKPRPALRVQFTPSYNKSRSMTQYVTDQVDATKATTFGTRYVFATLDQTELSATTRVDLTFTPPLSLQMFAQPLIAAANYYDFKELARPRVYDYDVYGRDVGTIAYNGTAREYTVDPDGAGAAPAFTFDQPNFNSRFLRGNALLRWEYRPGSVLFLVWQQSRSRSVPLGDFDLARDAEGLWSAPPVNVFVIKATYWIGR